MNSINFVTCHDGFTINDMVSYNTKHNEGNGEDNRDGVNENLSWNCGFEGESDDLEIETLRERQIRNFATLLLISRGVPMMLSGDEVRRTQRETTIRIVRTMKSVGWTGLCSTRIRTCFDSGKG